ncbi:MFS transporter [Dactylosporangium sp. NPDC049742]|uniref:MFS transporter n=1 Tax=Dactylosporangium sp. NPDC049742 TaxID=3154737 RepID=UPI00341EA0F5
MNGPRAGAVTAAPAPPDLDPRRWAALLFIAVAQLMVVVDTTVVNIAIPSTQADLGMADGDRQWIIAAYTLAFGGLLLLGGRVTDLLGRRRAFLIGLTGFAVASALGGAATGSAMLITARALQGVFGALLSPAALAMVTVMFTEPKERGKAFGIYNAVAGSGLAAGLILGGVLTQFLNWRWAFYISIPFAAVAAVGAVAVVREPALSRRAGRLDLPGAALVGVGLVGTVLAFATAESDGWASGRTLGLAGAAAVLLAAFTVVERRGRAPLLPPRLVGERNRAGVYLALGLSVLTMFGLFLFMTYYLQTVKGYSPVVAGLGFLPMVAGMVVGSTQLGGRLLAHVPPRVLISGGFVIAAGGMLLLTRLRVDSAYTAVLLPAGVLIGLGLGSAFVPAMSVATLDVEPRDTGVASAMVNAVQEVGGSIGTVLLNGIAAAATATYLGTHTAASTDPSEALRLEAMVHGFAVATWWAIGILVLAALLAVILITARPGRAGHGGPASGKA